MSSSYRRRPVKIARSNRRLRRSSRPGLGKPGLAADQAVAIAAEEDLVEVIDDRAVIDLDSQIGRDLLRQRPIVIPAAGVLVLLDQIARDALCR